MRLLPTLAATLAALAAAATVQAAPSTVMLDFEAPASFASIADFYAADGVTFGGDVLAIQNDALSAYFSNAPSPVGVMTAVGADATMNVAFGFTEMGLWYSSADNLADAVQVWSGVDGTGDLLGSLSLAANATDGCTDTAFCNFDFVAFGDWRTTRARSVTFSGAAFVAAFDDVSLKVPEPTSAVLAAIALAGVAVSRRLR